MHGDLAAGHDQHIVGRDLDGVALAQIGGDRLAQRQDAVGGGVAVLAVVQRLDGGLDDMGRGFEVGLADAEVDDVAPLRLQGRGLRQHREGVLLADAFECRVKMQHVPSLPSPLWRGSAARASAVSGFPPPGERA